MIWEDGKTGSFVCYVVWDGRCNSKNDRKKRRDGLLCLFWSHDENMRALLAGLPKEAIHIENPVQDVIFKVLQISYFISKDKVVIT